MASINTGDKVHTDRLGIHVSRVENRGHIIGKTDNTTTERKSR